ncbi:hypothetical protein D9M68_882720 [compost metagenome]
MTGMSFTWVMPAWMRWANCTPRSRLAVNTALERPYSLRLASSRACSASRADWMPTSGPKISSRAISMSAVTLPNTWGGMTLPSGSPPTSRVAPSALAVAIFSFRPASCLALITGPTTVPGLLGSP